MNSFSDEIFEQFSQIQKLMSNEKRMRILLKLSDKESSWSGLMQELDIRNPKILQDHLNLLSKNVLIKKSASGMYMLTEKGEILSSFCLDELSRFSNMQKKTRKIR